MLSTGRKGKADRAELERKLCELRLKVEDLGKKEKYAGEDVYTHIIFSEKALSLVKISIGLNSIWKVWDKLPDIIQQKVKEMYTTWTEFCTAIKGVEMAHIRNGVKKYQKEKEEREKTEVAITGLQHMQQQQQQQCRLPAMPITPVSSISHAMQMTSLGAQHNNQNAASKTLQSGTANTNPFTKASGGQGNLFRPPPPPVTQADQDMLNHSLTLYPIQPKNPAGTMAWHNQLRDWKVKNRENAQITASMGTQGVHPLVQGNVMDVGWLDIVVVTCAALKTQSTTENAPSTRSADTSFTLQQLPRSTSSPTQAASSIGSTIRPLYKHQAREMGKGCMCR